jgi:hypothetical protein
LIALFLTNLDSCTSASSERISLVSFIENYVEISIYLERNSEGKHFLSATFTPPQGYHLYSKDIPPTGVDGVGRPTLLALTSNSALKATGGLIESVKAQTPDFEPKELLVYPAGTVTLKLPVELPPGNDWIEDEVKVTYMACSASLCKPPVVGKTVSLQVPGADMLEHK